MNASLALGMNSVVPLASQPIGFRYPESEFFAYGRSSNFSTSLETSPSDPKDSITITSTQSAGSVPSYAGVVLTNNHTNPAVKIGKHRCDFKISVASGDVFNHASGPMIVFAFRDPDTNPNAPHVGIRTISSGSNSFEFETFDDSSASPPNYSPSIFFSCRPWSNFVATISQISLTYLD
jgi:hypothetical protein|tara:strand:+ start:323 stop:859 length:537 start_codon:yes stop_codon:yes gene_type:complete